MSGGGCAFADRTTMLVGQQGVARLAAAHVAVFGVGGVGGFACEALARAGVGALTLFDHDAVAPSNCNRQLTALHSTLGQPKVEVMARRIGDINPDCRVKANPVFYSADNAADYPFEDFDFVADAVDTVSAKLEIISRAKAAGLPVVSAMGAGNKQRADLFEVDDIQNTSVCPLARVMRKELKKRGIRGVPVVYSKEPPLRPLRGPLEEAEPTAPGTGAPTGPRLKPVPGSLVHVVGSAGLLLAGYIIGRLLEG